MSSLVNILSGQREEQQMKIESNSSSNGNSNVLITRDLLGGWSKIGSDELNLDSHVHERCDKHHDLKTGKIYLQRCNCLNSPSSSSSSDYNMQKHEEMKTKTTSKTTRTTNFLSNSTEQPLKSLEESCVELNLRSNSRYEYQSVCTLDKVKSALERAGKEEAERRKRSSTPSLPSPSSSSAGVFAAACPGCLLYVLTSSTNPRCPSCGSFVPSPPVVMKKKKKPRIDLNSTF